MLYPNFDLRFPRETSFYPVKTCVKRSGDMVRRRREAEPANRQRMAAERDRACSLLAVRRMGGQIEAFVMRIGSSLLLLRAHIGVISASDARSVRLQGKELMNKLGLPPEEAIGNSSKPKNSCEPRKRHIDST